MQNNQAKDRAIMNDRLQKQAAAMLKGPASA
jgi:hypothetical protein